jgi:hypothetical protein
MAASLASLRQGDVERGEAHASASEGRDIVAP